MASRPNKLAKTLHARRIELGLSAYAVAQRAGIARSTYKRLEAEQITDPRSENLQAIAAALDMSASDLYAAAGRLPKQDLPSFGPYLRTKYHLTEDAIADISRTIRDKYGIEMSGPAAGEDE